MISYSSYDNILNYCLNPKSDTPQTYSSNDYNSNEKQFETCCSNYDNLSYLTKKVSKKAKISSCKDYFTNSKNIVFNENKHSKYTNILLWHEVRTCFLSKFKTHELFVLILQ